MTLLGDPDRAGHSQMLYPRHIEQRAGHRYAGCAEVFDTCLDQKVVSPQLTVLGNSPACRRFWIHRQDRQDSVTVKPSSELHPGNPPSLA